MKLRPETDVPPSEMHVDTIQLLDQAMCRTATPIPRRGMSLFFVNSVRIGRAQGHGIGGIVTPMAEDAEIVEFPLDQIEVFTHQSRGTFDQGELEKLAEPPSDGGRPPPAGSAEAYRQTLDEVGFPGAFHLTCNQIERELISSLFWEL
jgi:hypothetical protein